MCAWVVTVDSRGRGPTLDPAPENVQLFAQTHAALASYLNPSEVTRTGVRVSGRRRRRGKEEEKEVVADWQTGRHE